MLSKIPSIILPPSFEAQAMLSPVLATNFFLFLFSRLINSHFFLSARSATIERRNFQQIQMEKLKLDFEFLEATSMYRQSHCIVGMLW
jgi:hypothetical protein